MCQREISKDRPERHDPVPAAVTGNEGRFRILHPRKFPRPGHEEPGQSFCLSMPGKTGQANDFPFAGTEPFRRLQHFFADALAAFDCCPGDSLLVCHMSHGIDQALLGKFGRRSAGDDLAVLHHVDP